MSWSASIGSNSKLRPRSATAAADGKHRPRLARCDWKGEKGSSRKAVGPRFRLPATVAAIRLELGFRRGFAASLAVSLEQTKRAEAGCELRRGVWVVDFMHSRRWLGLGSREDEALEDTAGCRVMRHRLDRDRPISESATGAARARVENLDSCTIEYSNSSVLEFLFQKYTDVLF